MKITSPLLIKSNINIFNQNKNKSNDLEYRNNSTSNHNAYFEALKNYTIAFCRSKVSVYSINKENGSYQKFNDMASAAAELGLQKRSIAKCISGELNSTGGYMFIKASDVETQDGAFDETKLKSIIQNILPHNSKAIYVIKPDGTYQRFESQMDAVRELNLDKHGVCNCLSGKLESSKGYAYIWAKDVETTNQDRITEVDVKKLKSLATAFKKNSSPIYAFDESGNYKKFNNPYQASQDLQIGNTGIRHCLKGEYSTTNGYVFAYAKDIEVTDDQGKTTLDPNKVEELLENFVNDKNAIYAINPQGDYQKFLTQNEAARTLGLDRHDIGACLSGEYMMTHDYIFVRAQDVETRVNGKKTVDILKIKEALFDYMTRGVYAIYKDGTYQRFESQKEASDILGIEASRISACVRGERKKTSDFTFIKASSVEKFDDNTGNVILNTDLLEKLSKVRLASSEIYFVDKYGNYKKFKNRAEAAKMCKVDPSDLTRHLFGLHNFSKGIYFISANKLEKQDKQGNTVVDKEKIEQIRYKIAKRAIYVIAPDRTYQRIDSRWLAARLRKGMYFDALLNTICPMEGYGIVRALNVEFKDRNGNYRLNRKKMQQAIENIRKQAVYVYNISTGECTRYNHTKRAALESEAFILNKDLKRYELKEGYYIINAPDIETLDLDNNMFQLDKKKLEEEIGLLQSSK